MDLFNIATSPSQYDGESILWEQESSIKSPFRKFILTTLEKNNILSLSKNATVLEIGAGTGWLVNHLIQENAKSIDAIEPAKNLFQPQKNITFHNQSFESFTSSKQFDLILSMMVINHVADIKKAFSKIHSLLQTQGTFVMLVPGFEYNKIKRHESTIQKISKDEFVVSKKRVQGTIADVVRSKSYYQSQAKKVGLYLQNHSLCKPTDNLIKSHPRYKDFKEQGIIELFVFKKQ